MTPTVVSATTAPSTATLAPHCEAPIAQTAGTHGMLAVLCRQSRYIRSWHDSAGTLHRACPKHLAQRTALYAPADAPWPGDLPALDEPETVPAAACGLCAAGWLPPHEASLRCESGRRPHCTCSVCF